MNRFLIFSYINSLTIVPLEQASAATTQALAAWWGPILVTALAITVVAAMLWRSLSGGQGGIEKLLQILVGGAIAITVAGGARYHGMLTTFVMHDLIDGASSVIAGGVGGQPLSAAAFDEAWATVVASGLSYWKHVPSGIGSSVLGALVVMAFWFVSLIAIALGFAIWIMAKFSAFLLLSLAPVFIGCAALGGTFRRWFHGWLNTLGSSVVLSLLAVVLLGIVLRTERGILDMVQAEMKNPSSSFMGFAAVNEWTMANGLLAGFVLNAVFLFMTGVLPLIASSITHGAAGAVPGAVMSFADFAGGMVRGATLGAAAAGGAAIQAGANVIAPPNVVPTSAPPGPAMGSPPPSGGMHSPGPRGFRQPGQFP